MVDILIAQTSPNTYTFRAKRFKSISLEYNSPATAISLPEDKAEKAMIFKMEGNIEVYNITFQLVEEVADVVTGYGSPTKTVMEQLLFLLNVFPPTTFNHAYTFTIESTGFTRTGIITKLMALTDEADPVNYNFTITFQVGQVISVVSSESES